MMKVNLEQMKKFSVNDLEMSAVSGGVMPDGYYDQLKNYMKGAAAEGLTKEAMLTDLKDEFSGSVLPQGMTRDDVSEILSFVDKNWPGK